MSSYFISVNLVCASEYKMECNIWHKNSQRSLSSFQGKFVVLYIWANWCLDCVEGLKKLQQTGLKDSDALAIAPVFLGNKTHEQVMIFYGKNAIKNLEIYVDRDKSIMTTFNISMPPTTIVLNPEGEVILKLNGLLSSAELELIYNLTGIQKAMNQGAPPQSEEMMVFRLGAMQNQ